MSGGGNPYHDEEGKFTSGPGGGGGAAFAKVAKLGETKSASKIMAALKADGIDIGPIQSPSYAMGERWVDFKSKGGAGVRLRMGDGNTIKAMEIDAAYANDGQYSAASKSKTVKNPTASQVARELSLADKRVAKIKTKPNRKTPLFDG